jgi:hypothetical protein
MDLRCEMEDGKALVSVDVLADAGMRENDARVSAEVYFVTAASLGAPLQPVQKLALRQSGPGLYEGTFKPEQAGVYLVRAQSGAQMVTAGLVNNPGGEASLGTVNEKLLHDVCKITGGSYLEGDAKLNLGGSRAKRYVELWPYLAVALLLLFLVDVAVRRWEHVVGIFEVVSGWLPGAKSTALK